MEEKCDRVRINFVLDFIKSPLLKLQQNTLNDTGMNIQTVKVFKYSISVMNTDKKNSWVVRKKSPNGQENQNKRQFYIFDVSDHLVQSFPLLSSYHKLLRRSIQVSWSARTFVRTDSTISFDNSSAWLIIQFKQLIAIPGNCARFKNSKATQSIFLRSLMIARLFRDEMHAGWKLDHG